MNITFVIIYVKGNTFCLVFFVPLTTIQASKTLRHYFLENTLPRQSDNYIRFMSPSSLTDIFKSLLPILFYVKYMNV